MADVPGKLLEWWNHPAQMVEELFQVTPDAWQAEALEAFPHNPRIAMKAPLALSTVVPTPIGSRGWSEISIGDQLFAEDGSITTVVARHDVGEVPLYRVTFTDGTSVEVSADHEWDVATPYDRLRNSRRTVSTTELSGLRLKAKNTGQRLVSIPVQGATQLPERLLPADPYVLGLWLGDGIANEPRLICPDAAIRKAIIGRGQLIGESGKNPKRISLLGWADSLRATGMAKCRSYEKSIPETYRLSSVGQRLALLRGLMDSDGTCALNGQCYLASCSPALVTDFAWLARSLGYLARISGPYQINGGLNRDSYRVTISGAECPFLAQTEKRRRWRKPKPHRFTRFVESVEFSRTAEAMCVEIDHESHCFQAQDFIVTHNCKGPGKSAVLAWLGWNFLLTRPHPMCGATSISGDNLKACLWTELARWYERAPLLKTYFELTKTEIFSREHPKTWKMEARTWAKDADASQIGNALAGIHAEYVLWLLDESGDYPDAILPTCEAIFSGNPAEAHIVQAGNPTRLSGPLYRACVLSPEDWYVVEITGDPDSPKRSPRIPVEHARQQIRNYGRDNPWVLINIFGEFPPSSLNALLGPDEVRRAFDRKYQQHDIDHAPRILGVDVARFGDDSSVVFPRQGLVAFPPKVMRNVDGIRGAGQVARTWEDWDVDACFIDNTGGWGASWIDVLRTMNRHPIPVGFAERAEDKRYANRRAEMWFAMVQWIKDGGGLPDVPELVAELTQTTYTFKGDAFLLEPKESIKDKIGRSPDLADGLALTFAAPVATKRMQDLRPKSMRRREENYDPFAAFLGR